MLAASVDPLEGVQVDVDAGDFVPLLWDIWATIREHFVIILAIVAVLALVNIVEGARRRSSRA